MSKKTKEETKPQCWHRLEVILTGEGLISQSHAAGARSFGAAVDYRKVEETTMSLDLRDYPEILGLIKSIVEKERQTKALKDKIKAYQDASKKIQEAV